MCRIGRRARGFERLEAALADRLAHVGAAGHRDVMAGRGGRARQWHERIEMTLTAGEGEQDPHGYSSPAAIEAATSATIP